MFDGFFLCVCVCVIFSNLFHLVISQHSYFSFNYLKSIFHRIFILEILQLYIKIKQVNTNSVTLISLCSIAACSSKNLNSASLYCLALESHYNLQFSGKWSVWHSKRGHVSPRRRNRQNRHQRHLFSYQTYLPSDIAHEWSRMSLWQRKIKDHTDRLNFGSRTRHGPFISWLNTSSSHQPAVPFLFQSSLLVK